MSWLAAAIGVGGQLLSNRSQRKQQEQAWENQSLVARRRDAEKAGFNPNMVIQGGGYASPVVSPIGDPWDDIGDIVSGAVEQRRRERLEETGVRQENKELRDRLKEIARQGEPSYMQQHGAAIPLPSQGETDERFRPAYQANGGDGGGSVGRSGSGDNARLVEVKREEAIEGLTIGGLDVKPVPWMSDAEMVEQRYGDVASWVYGIGVGASDAAINIGIPVAKWRRDTWDENVAELAEKAEKRRDERQKKPSFNNLEFGISPLPRVGGGALPPSFEHFLQ